MAFAVHNESWSHTIARENTRRKKSRRNFRRKKLLSCRNDDSCVDKIGEEDTKFVRESYGILPVPQSSDCSPVGPMPHRCGCNCEARKGRLRGECEFRAS